jgi:hypothetical protein
MDYVLRQRNAFCLNFCSTIGLIPVILLIFKGKKVSKDKKKTFNLLQAAGFTGCLNMFGFSYYLKNMHKVGYEDSLKLKFRKELMEIEK